MLSNRGYKTKAGRNLVMKHLRSIVLQQFFKVAFGDITAFGKNLYRIRIGNGEKSK